MRVKSIFILAALLIALIFLNQTIFTAGEESIAEKSG